MAGKSLAIGEGGIIVTNDCNIYERAASYGHYERTGSDMEDKWLAGYAGLPMGGVKHRMHQISSAVGRVQLKYYDERILVIREAIDYFWSKLTGVKGLTPHRIDDSLGDMAGWYLPFGHYNPEALGGLSVSTFAQAIRKEGFAGCMNGCNSPLHTHPILQNADIYNQGKPTRIVNSDRDVRLGDKSLPVSEIISERICSVPWFKHFDKAVIEMYAGVYIKVLDAYEELLELDKQHGTPTGRWNFYVQKS